jgi:hypothetical protein
MDVFWELIGGLILSILPKKKGNGNPEMRANEARADGKKVRASAS